MTVYYIIYYWNLEYSPVNRFVDQESESDEESDVKVGTVRNVRVIAIEDNTPPTGSKELTFKKGNSSAIYM